MPRAPRPRLRARPRARQRAGLARAVRGTLLVGALLADMRLARAAAIEEDAGVPSKKQQFLVEKRARSVRATRLRERLARPAITLRNQWTHELVALPAPTKTDPARPPAPRALDGFLRDHFTNQQAAMDPRLGEVLLRAALQFKASLVEVVSGFRSEKYNLMLRKKGHAVARDSQHPMGNAVDFRVAGVATRALFRYVRSLRLGGAGYYPRSGFVHADVGRVRTWVGN